MYTGPVTTPHEFPIKTKDPLSAETGGHHWLLASSTGHPRLYEVYREECYCTRCGALWTQQNRYLQASATSTRYIWRETTVQNPPEVPPCPGDVRFTADDLQHAREERGTVGAAAPTRARGRKAPPSPRPVSDLEETLVAPI